MEAFTYCVPTEVVFGRHAESKAGNLVRRYGGSRVLVVYGGGSAERSGLLERVGQSLTDAGLIWKTLGGVKPNPRLSFAREGVRLAIEFECDFLLAVGGGSVIDTAKAIAHGLANPETDIWQFWLKKEIVRKTTPVGVILTIPAAGSETSDSAVLTDEETGSKRGLGTPLNRPRFAIMNPELTFTLPKYQIACGVTDIMMHTMERYFNPVENELTDAIAEALLRTVIDKGRSAIQDGCSYDSMSEVMWAGSLSHNGLTGLGTRADWATHQLGHELSAKYDLAHGASLAATWGSWARYVYQEDPARFARYARNVWNVVEKDDEAAALAGINATEQYFSSIGMPVNMPECVGMQSEEQLREMAYRCTYQRTRTIGSFKVLGEEDIYQIYSSANHAAKDK